jgi:hypothetical protein
MVIELTQEQIDLLPVYRDKWLKIGLDTTPLDKDKATKAIHKAYECGGLEPPKEIIFTESPLDSYNVYKNLIDNRSSVRWTLKYYIRNSVIDYLWNTINSNVGERFSDSFGEYTRNFVVNSIRLSVMHSIIGSVNESVMEFIKESIRVINYGNHDSSILYYYNYLQEGCGLQEKKQILEGLMEVAYHCGWFIPFEDICIVSSKPTKINLRENSRGIKVIHAEGEPAISYSDGFNIWGYDGVRLDNERYHTNPNNWKCEWLLDEDNAEIRRVLLQSLGSHRILSELDSKLLDTYREYELYEINNTIDIESYKLIKMICPSTGLTHTLRVPPDIITAKDGITWINHGTSPDEFVKEL